MESLGPFSADAEGGTVTDLLYLRVVRAAWMSAPAWVDNNNNNNRISIAPYGRNFRGAGGRSDQCSVKA